MSDDDTTPATSGEDSTGKITGWESLSNWVKDSADQAKSVYDEAKAESAGVADEAKAASAGVADEAREASKGVASEGVDSAREAKATGWKAFLKLFRG